jgi:hypothetical protein
MTVPRFCGGYGSSFIEQWVNDHIVLFDYLPSLRTIELNTWQIAFVSVAVRPNTIKSTATRIKIELWMTIHESFESLVERQLNLARDMLTIHAEELNVSAADNNRHHRISDV